MIVCIGILIHGNTVGAQAWEGRVTRVLDGDSLRIRHGAQVETIRLYGIDCPEYGQPGWQEAKNMTSALVRDQNVIVAPVDTDRYGRTVAVVAMRGRVLNTELVQTGMAWLYPQYCRTPSLCEEWETLEQRARQQRLGLWRERHPVPPWVWKQRQR
jgi:endonuclease YncB( thermonuclease family)